MRGKNLVIMQQEQFLRTQLTTSCSPSSPPRSCHFLWHGRHIKPLPPEQSRDIYREKVFGPISILPITSQRRHPTSCRSSSLLSMLSSHLPEKIASKGFVEFNKTMRRILTSLLCYSLYFSEGFEWVNSSLQHSILDQ